MCCTQLKMKLIIKVNKETSNSNNNPNVFKIQPHLETAHSSKYLLCHVKQGNSCLV